MARRFRETTKTKLTPEQRRRWRRALAAGVPEGMIATSDRRIARWQRGVLTQQERREYAWMLKAGVDVVTEFLARSERWLLRTWLPKLLFSWADPRPGTVKGNGRQRRAVGSREPSPN